MQQGGHPDNSMDEASVPSRFVQTPRGRGTPLEPANRFETLHLNVLGDHLDHEQQERDAASHNHDHSHDQGHADIQPRVQTHLLTDDSRSIINKIDQQTSTDIPFRWSLNPYRGCEHG